MKGNDMLDYLTSRECYEAIGTAMAEQLEYVSLQGWVRTNRFNGTFGFIELNDGTYFRNVQCIYDNKLANFETVSKLLTGAALTVTGTYKLTPENKQPFELVLTSVEIEGTCDNTYPLQKKRHSFEYLREIGHLRPRTNTFQAVFRVRSTLSMAIHEFFQNQGFIYVHTPIITGNDAEGAGEVFTVTTRDDGNYDEDFFGKHAALTVSGQLHAESYALAFRDVYTFGPTFRAENSNTTTHANEFWMIEPEIAFADLEDNMDLIQDMVQYCIQYVQDNCPLELDFFNSFIDKGLKERLEHVKNSDFKRLPYTQAVELLKQADVKFENSDIYWGMDLATEHERYLCEKVVKGPVFITDYPKEMKAFYMRVNDDQKTVAACDLLVPGVGELVGGSQREERLDVLMKVMEERNMNPEGLQWYLDLRRFGGCKHAGFGLGFERFLMYITGMENIRDVIPFPRTPRNLNF